MAQLFFRLADVPHHGAAVRDQHRDNNAAQERYGRKEKHTRLPMPAQPSEATIESLEWVQTLAVKRTRLPPVR